jgi:hypothetical protein
LDTSERGLRCSDVRLDIRSVNLDMVECDLDFLDLTLDTCRPESHSRVRELGSGNVTLDCRIRNVGQISRTIGHIRT